jgi:ABC-type taurine transport system substrate-binding protein
MVSLGFLTNITHASALVGLKEGFFAKALGSAGTLKATAFSTGTEETTALLAGQLDAAYVGPNPAINAWQKSGGSAIKIISGAATGGASVVVTKGITAAAQLKGKTLATPSLGNTQDVALRAWLKQNGLTTTSTDDAQLGRGARVQVRADRRRIRARALRRGDGQGRRHGAVHRNRRHHLARGGAELPVSPPGDRR